MKRLTVVLSVVAIAFGMILLIVFARAEQPVSQPYKLHFPVVGAAQGSTVADITLRWSPTGVVQCRIPDDAPLNGYKVTISDCAGNTLGEGVTDAQGKIFLRFVSAPKIIVRLETGRGSVEIAPIGQVLHRAKDDLTISFYAQRSNCSPNESFVYSTWPTGTCR